MSIKYILNNIRSLINPFHHRLLLMHHLVALCLFRQSLRTLCKEFARGTLCHPYRIHHLSAKTHLCHGILHDVADYVTRTFGL